MYYWDNYKYCNGTNESLTKYCTKTSCGEFAFVYNKTILDLTDDAARVNWGGSWRMPTAARHCYLENLGNVGIDCEYLTTCKSCM